MATSTTPLLSIIIPTLNEEASLPLLLADIAGQQGVPLEAIVADGGSTDGTEAAAAAGGARIVRARRGRGAQMNDAAGQARGGYLLFLHADSRFSSARQLADAIQALREATWRSPRVAGHFSLQFQRSSKGNTLAYRYMEAKTRLNRINTTNGDQGFLLTRQWFHELGGFDERLPFLEDQRLAERIRCQGCWITLPGVLTTSARRFETEGLYRRYLSMGLIMVAFSTGMDGFFTRLPGLYRLHHHCGKLLIFPILTGFFRTLFAGSRLGTIGARIERVGRYLSQNGWQPFFLIDVLRGQRRFILLPLYDRWIAPALRHRLAALVLGWTAVFIFAVLITPLAWMMEWWPQPRALRE